jgi:hypothetical protein
MMKNWPENMELNNDVVVKIPIFRFANFAFEELEGFPAV